jgi:hypothetical protein
VQAPWWEADRSQRRPGRVDVVGNSNELCNSGVGVEQDGAGAQSQLTGLADGSGVEQRCLLGWQPDPTAAEA